MTARQPLLFNGTGFDGGTLPIELISDHLNLSPAYPVQYFKRAGLSCLTVVGNVSIQHFANHSLVFGVISLCLPLKEIDARFLKSYCYFRGLISYNKLTRRRQKIPDSG